MPQRRPRGFESTGAAEGTEETQKTNAPHVSCVFSVMLAAAIAIAVRNAASKLAASSGNPPTGATNGVPKDGSIIAIASGRTGAVCVKRNRA